MIWGHISSEVAQVAEDDFAVAKDELRTNQTKRWRAVGMLKHIFSSAKLPWKLKEYAMDFLLYITSGNNSQKCNDENMDCSFYTSTILAALEVIFSCSFEFIHHLFSKVLSNSLEKHFRLLKWSLYMHQRQF